MELYLEVMIHHNGSLLASQLTYSLEINSYGLIMQLGVTTLMDANLLIYF